MKDYEFSSLIAIRRLPYVSLFKIFLLGGAGLVVPFCVLALLFALFSPSSVRLQEGQTMTQFILMIAATSVIWPFMFAGIVGTAAWIAFGVKSLLSPTTIELVRDERDLPPRELIQPPQTTTGSSAADRV